MDKPTKVEVVLTYEDGRETRFGISSEFGIDGSCGVRNHAFKRLTEDGKLDWQLTGEKTLWCNFASRQTAIDDEPLEID